MKFSGKGLFPSFLNKNQALCLVFLWLSVFALQGQPKTAGGQARVPRLSVQEAEEMLQNVRRGSLPFNMFSYFTLEQKSASGKEVFFGNLWAMPLEQGPLFRITLRAARNNSVEMPLQSEFILKGGAQAQCWQVVAMPEGPAKIEPVSMNQTLLPSLSISCFDLLTPYLYWPRYDYINSDRYLNRPVQIYDMKESEKSSTNAFVRISVDNSYHVLLRSELWSMESLSKTVKVRSIKKVDGQYIPKTIDFKDHSDRSRTRFTITDAALRVPMSLEMFDVKALEDPVVIDKNILNHL